MTPARRLRVAVPPVNLRDDKRRKIPVRPPGGGRGNIRRRRGRRARTFVRRDQVLALVPAVGSGALLDGESKLFLRLGRKTLVEIAVDRLLRCVGTVLVGVAAADVERVATLLGERAEVHAVGPEYAEALQQLLAQGSAPFVLVHDVSWPFASPALIRDVVLAAVETGVAAAVDYATTAVGRLAGDTFETLAEGALVAQSPSAFRREPLEAALRESGAGLPQTPWTLLQRSGAVFTPVQNEKWNVPISSARDWEFARKILWPALRRRRTGDAARP